MWYDHHSSAERQSEEQTLQLFKEADLEVRRTDRDYNPRIHDPRIEKVKILRPQEIPTYVEMGYFDIGISGLDWIHESGAQVKELAQLNYSKTGPGIVRSSLRYTRMSRSHQFRRFAPTAG
jgi:ATP phosphoribosyltransferase